MRVINGVTGIVVLGFLGFIGCSAGAPAAGDEQASSSAASDEELKLGRLCEGPIGLSCPKGQYCSARASKACPGPRTFGICAPQPQACTDLFAPVCGCDGHTYSNSCFAAAVGVAVEHLGACPADGPMCGGIAGIPCPGLGKCVDDPSDDCDPAKGGADCSGICSCIQTVACKLGTHFDSEPEVCSCVPDAATQ